MNKMLTAALSYLFVLLSVLSVCLADCSICRACRLRARPVINWLSTSASR